MQITVDIPERYDHWLAEDDRDGSLRLLQDAAVGAYYRDAITKYELQQILGLATRNELDGVLKNLGVEHGAYSGQDLLDDLAAFRSTE